MKLVAFDDLYRGPYAVFHFLGEGSAGVSAIGQNALDAVQMRLGAVQGLQRTAAVGHLGRGDGDGMRQTLSVHRDVALDAGDLLARVIALLFGAIGVLHALRVNDQEAGCGVAPLSGAGLANGFFLRPAPEH